MRWAPTCRERAPDAASRPRGIASPAQSLPPDAPHVHTAPTVGHRRCHSTTSSPTASPTPGPPQPALVAEPELLAERVYRRRRGDTTSVLVPLDLVESAAAYVPEPLAAELRALLDARTRRESA